MPLREARKARNLPNRSCGTSIPEVIHPIKNFVRRSKDRDFTLINREIMGHRACVQCQQWVNSGGSGGQPGYRQSEVIDRMTDRIALRLAALCFATAEPTRDNQECR